MSPFNKLAEDNYCRYMVINIYMVLVTYSLPRRVQECVVPENIHTHPLKGQWKFRGCGAIKSQNVLRKFEALVVFSKGRKLKLSDPSWKMKSHYVLQTKVVKV